MKIYKDDDCVIEFCSKQMKKKLAARRQAFNEAIDNLKHLQLRYSIFALLSNRYYSLFDDSMVELAQYLNSEELSGTKEAAMFSAFILG